jgi:hypothetical protein
MEQTFELEETVTFVQTVPSKHTVEIHSAQ